MDHIKMSLKQNKNPQKTQKWLHVFFPKKIQKRPQIMPQGEVLSNMGIFFVFLGIFFYYSGDFCII